MLDQRVGKSLNLALWRHPDSVLLAGAEPGIREMQRLGWAQFVQRRLMATEYQILPEGLPMDLREGYEKSRYQTREEADVELRARRGTGERPQLIKWVDGRPQRVSQVPRPQ
jgi:hypothetical protein